MCKNTVEVYEWFLHGLEPVERPCGTEIKSPTYPFRKMDTLRCDDCQRSNAWMNLQHLSFTEVNPND